MSKILWVSLMWCIQNLDFYGNPDSEYADVFAMYLTDEWTYVEKDLMRTLQNELIGYENKGS